MFTIMRRLPKSGGLWSAGLAVTALLWLVVLVPSVAAASTGGFSDFPLSKDVPGSTFATLGEGRLPDGTRWGAYASRLGEAPSRRREPCISVARITRTGEYANRAGCGPLAPEGKLRLPVYVSISGSYRNHPNGPVIGETIAALSFARSIRKVQLTFSTGGVLSRRTRELNSQQQKKARLASFRYIVLSMQKDLCVESIVGFDEHGSSLLDAQTEICP